MSACRCAPTSRSMSTRCWRRSRASGRRWSGSRIPTIPPATCSTRAAIERIIRAAPGLGRGRRGVLRVCRRARSCRACSSSPTCVVVRTVSKIGMAGAAPGLRGGASRLDRRARQGAAALQRQRADAGGGAACCSPTTALLAEQAAAIRAERERVRAALAALRRVTVFPSQANFVLVAGAGRQRHWFEHVARRGHPGQECARHAPAARQCLRITVGTPDENDALLRALAHATP